MASRRNVVLDVGADGLIVVENVDDPMAFWEASRAFFLARRPVMTNARKFRYPATTNDDVRQLVTHWNTLHLLRWRADVLDEERRARWRKAYALVLELTSGAPPSATFARNEDFWLVWTKQEAIWLSVAMNVPTRREQIIDAIGNTVADLPGDVANLVAGAAGGAADVVAAAGNKAGKIVAAPVHGLFSGLFGAWGRPLLVGALVVGGVIVVPRLLSSERRRAPSPPREGA